jgi:hypothetical protein
VSIRPAYRKETAKVQVEAALKKEFTVTKYTIEWSE